MQGVGTVVVIDDEEGICGVLRDVLEDEGYVVGVTGNGVDGLALLQALPTKPKVVFLDLVMPLLDGLEVYRSMKADPDLADVPVVVMTSEPSRAPSGVAIMKKPVALDRVLDVVRRAAQGGPGNHDGQYGSRSSS